MKTQEIDIRVVRLTDRETVFRERIEHAETGADRAALMDGMRRAIGITSSGRHLMKFRGNDYAVTITVDGVVLYADSMYERHMRGLMFRLTRFRTEFATRMLDASPEPPPGEPTFDDDVFASET